MSAPGAKLLKLTEKIVTNPVILRTIFKFYAQPANIYYGKAKRTNVYELHRSKIDKQQVVDRNFDTQVDLIITDIYKFRIISRAEEMPFNDRVYGYVRELPEGFKDGALIEFPLYDNKRIYLNSSEFEVINGITRPILYRLICKPYRF